MRMNFKIKEIYLDNFKSFKNCSIKLDKFNVVVAPNNAGKSNLISALEFIASTFRYGLYRTIDEFGGLETIRNYRSSEEENITIGVKSSINYAIYSLTEMFIDVFKGKGESSSIRFELKDINIDIKFSFLDKITNLFLYIDGKYKVSDKHKNFRNFYLKYSFGKEEKLETNISEKYKNRFLRIFIEFGFTSIKDLDSLELNDLEKIYTYHFIPTIIRNPDAYEGGNKLNKFGLNIYSVLDNLKSKYPKIFENISTALIGIVDELEGIEIDYDTLGRAKLNFKERLSNTKTKFIPIDIVSDGTINLIATLTALYEPYQKSLIAIEEPERHLHLKAISYLMEEFRNISEEKQVLITTQNSEILHNLDLKKDNLIFLFRDYEGNTKAITHRDIPNFRKKLKFYKNDIVELIKQEGLGYLGDYIGEKEEKI